MWGLRQALFEPSDRYDGDLGSRRGLLGGLFQAGLHLVAFALLFVLAILVGTLDPGGGSDGSMVDFWAVVLAGAATGGGMVALAEVRRVDRIWRTVVGRLVTVLALYVAYWGLLATVGLDAVFGGLAFVVARVVALAWSYRRARR